MFILLALTCVVAAIVGLVWSVMALLTAEGRALLGATLIGLTALFGGAAVVFTACSLSTTRILDYSGHCPRRSAAPIFLPVEALAEAGMPVAGVDAVPSPHPVARAWTTRGPGPALGVYETQDHGRSEVAGDPDGSDGHPSWGYVLFVADRPLHREAPLAGHLGPDTLPLRGGDVAVTEGHVVHGAGRSRTLTVFRSADRGDAPFALPPPLRPALPEDLALDLTLSRFDDPLSAEPPALSERVLEDREGRLLMLFHRPGDGDRVLMRLEGEHLRALGGLPGDARGLRKHRSRDRVCLDRGGTWSLVHPDTGALEPWPVSALREDRAAGLAALLLGLVVLGVGLRLLWPAVWLHRRLRRGEPRRRGRLRGDLFIDADGRELRLAGAPQRAGAIAGPCVAIGAVVVEPEASTYRGGQTPGLHAEVLVPEPFAEAAARVENRMRALVFLVGASLGLSALPALVFATGEALARLVAG